jgi:hypothetical protein
VFFFLRLSFFYYFFCVFFQNYFCRFFLIWNWLKIQNLVLYFFSLKHYGLLQYFLMWFFFMNFFLNGLCRFCFVVFFFKTL